jgi:hypothetical protein
MTKTAEHIDTYRRLPIAGVSSNEPYAVGKDPVEAEIRQGARDEFIASEEGSWPENNYPLLNEEELRMAERQLLSILNGILESESTSEAEADVAYEQVALKLAEVYRHLEVIRGLGRVAAARELSRERAGTMTLEIFGEPDPQVFGSFWAKERSQAEAIAGQGDESIAVVAREFLALTGEGEQGEDIDASLELSDSTMEIIREDFTELFPGAKEFFEQPIEGEVSPEDALPYFDEALAVLGLDKKGWKAVSSNGRACETKGPLKELRVGKKRGAFTPDTIKGVAWHEALHAYRYQNMTEQDSPAKQTPLPGNVDFEEGALTSVEQMITGERRVAGLAYYMSLGLQLNLDNGSEKRRDFRGTHEIMWRRSLLQNYAEGSVITDADIAKAKGTSFQTVIRTTRGNSLDARDISYFEGGRKATRWFNEIAQLPEEERRRKLRIMLSAKFDPTNPIQEAFFDEPSQTN